jgi:hypothetical protein
MDDAIVKLQAARPSLGTHSWVLARRVLMRMHLLWLCLMLLTCKPCPSFVGACVSCGL